jgi:hypothetical protein
MEKIFKQKIFNNFVCAPLPLTPIVHLEPRISPGICENFDMAVMVNSDAWGKLIHEKKQKSKIS